MEEPQPLPQTLSPCSSGRRRKDCDTNSPEFEFWMVRNPSFPQPNLLSADELFSDGFLLPLHLLHLSNEPPPTPAPTPQDTQESGPGQVPEPEPSTTTSRLNASKRWRYIFKKNDKQNTESSTTTSADDHCVKEKKRDKKNGGAVGTVGASSVVSAAELNINIWPFSRSRSAGNGGARPRSTSATRRVSSAPCSRSNSTGESKTRKWPPNSPSRGGVHLGRSSPVWQVRRGGGSGAGRNADAFIRKIPAASGSKARVLSLNVPMCIGYRNNLSCRNDENSEVSIAAAAAGNRGGGGGGGGSQIGGGVSGEGVRRSNLFNIRSLFTKKDH